MKNILFILLLCITQMTIGQIESRPISTFASYNADKELLVDVRTPQEYDAGHLDGAINIDWFSDDFNAQVATLDTNKIIYVYCKKGGRSLKAQARLVALGFIHVINLEGGYDTWSIAHK